jgi:hypothetical protein
MKKLFLSTLIVAAFATLTFAQSGDEYKKGEFYVGVSGNYTEGNISSTDPFYGINVSGVYNVSKYVGIKGDVSTAYRRRTFPIGQGQSLKTTSSIQNYLGGVQFKNNSREGRVKPFAHLLIGASVNGSKNNLFGSSFSRTSLAGVVGGGIDLRINKRVSLRLIQFDYNPILKNGLAFNNIRLGAGVVF